METVTVRMSRGDGNTPWGFQLAGGRDHGQQLSIGGLTPGSLAERAGLQRGDHVQKLCGRDAGNMSHNDAQSTVGGGGNNVDLVVQRAASGNRSIGASSAVHDHNVTVSKFQHSQNSPKMPQMPSMPVPQQFNQQQNFQQNQQQNVQQNTSSRQTFVTNPVIETPSTVHLQPSSQRPQTNVPGYNRSAEPWSSQAQGHDTTQSQQYNSPAALYSKSSNVNEYLQRTGGLFGTDPAIARAEEAKKNALNPATLRAVQAEDQHRALSRSPAPQFQDAPMNKATNESTEQSGSFNRLTSALGAEEMPAAFVDKDPTLRKMKRQGPGKLEKTIAKLEVLQKAEFTRAPVEPQQPHLVPGAPSCDYCGRSILGAFTRTGDRSYHAECFKCATCGSSLKNVGHVQIGGKLYCDIHAAQRQQNQFTGRPAMDPNSFVPSPHVRSIDRRSPLPYNEARTDTLMSRSCTVGPPSPRGGSPYEHQSQRWLCRQPHAPAMYAPKGQNGPPKAFYQPDIMSKGPVSPSHVRAASGISPSQRGVPKPYNVYGSEVTSMMNSMNMNERNQYLNPNQAQAPEITLTVQSQPPVVSQQWPPANQRSPREDHLVTGGVCKIGQRPHVEPKIATDYTDRRPPPVQREMLRHAQCTHPMPRAVNYTQHGNAEYNNPSEQHSPKYSVYGKPTVPFSLEITTELSPNAAGPIQYSPQPKSDQAVDRLSAKILEHARYSPRIPTHGSDFDFTQLDDALNQSMKLETSTAPSPSASPATRSPSFNRETETPPPSPNRERSKAPTPSSAEEDTPEHSPEQNRQTYTSELHVDFRDHLHVKKAESQRTSMDFDKTVADLEAMVDTFTVAAIEQESRMIDESTEMLDKVKYVDVERASFRPINEEVDVASNLRHEIELKRLQEETQKLEQIIEEEKSKRKTFVTESQMSSFQMEERQLSSADISQTDDLTNTTIQMQHLLGTNNAMRWSPVRESPAVTLPLPTVGSALSPAVVVNQRTMPQPALSPLAQSRISPRAQLQRQPMATADTWETTVTSASVMPENQGNQAPSDYQEEAAIPSAPLRRHPRGILKTRTFSTGEEEERRRAARHDTNRQSSRSMEWVMDEDGEMRERAGSIAMVDDCADAYAPPPPPAQYQAPAPAPQPSFNRPGAAPASSVPIGSALNGSVPSAPSGPGGNRQSAAVAPMRGRGLLQQANSVPRIPVCQDCRNEIRGPFILAAGKTWCPDHFKCANNQCNRALLDCGFVEEQGQKYCEVCFEQYFAPKCAKCSRAVVGDCLNALNAQFHPECFTCTTCHQPFGNSAFFLEDGKPYCEQDWNQTFTTKCVSCKFPIEAGDRWVEALNAAYHSDCFVCTMCHANLEGQSFYAKSGMPYCKAHA